MNKHYQVCTCCVMDTSDPDIVFDDNGVCSHCLEFDRVTSKNWFPDEEGERRLKSLLQIVCSEGEGRDYNCILGLSGGIDSSYLAFKVREWNLKPLVVHVDAGWNSELAVANIESIVKYCNFDLHTHVVDWEEMRDLQLAYLKSGVSNQDVPQDHIFFSSLYHFATKNRIRYILSGGNIATEGIFPKSWHGTAMDAINLRAIHRRYGKKSLTNYKSISFFDYYIWYPLIKGMRTIRPLNFIPYNKELAVKELEKETGWRNYGYKHGESRFTSFFQCFYLPVRFGYDKRRPHFSSLIVSGQMSRDEALRKLAEPAYDLTIIEDEIAFVCKKLQISRDDFFTLLREPIRSHTDFPNWNSRFRALKFLQTLLARATGREFRVYS